MKKIAILLYLILSAGFLFAGTQEQVEPWGFPRVLVHGPLRLYEDPSNGSNYAELRSADSLAANLVFVFPSDAGDGLLKVVNSSGEMTISRVGYLKNTATIDFTAKTNACEDSTGITVTGAVASDPCFVGAPAAAVTGQESYTCYVSAADTVKVHHCAVGTGADVPSGSFKVTVIQ